MEISFLLGPAGSGKTFRCLQEVRTELKLSPDGLPLIFLAPRQATYQIERALLSDPHLPGFTRLKVVGFETLAEFILQELSPAPPIVLSELGRNMVLRALLTRHHEHLRTFHASARMPGFAQHLGLVLEEIQQTGISIDTLRLAAKHDTIGVELSDKLLDLARLLEAYEQWLQQNDLHDPNRLLTLATAALNETKCVFHLGGVWLDGFAELSARELELLAAVVARSESATLAFCVDRHDPADLPWHSTWRAASRAVERCRLRLSEIAGASMVELEHLSRNKLRSRFAHPELWHLERNWNSGERFVSASAQLELLPNTIQRRPVTVLRCENPAEEAAVCAREILNFVRAGNRYRDVAVLLRSLKDYDDVLSRAFARYQIPFFIDRREPVAHHPLPELVRYALRLAANGWQQADWFGALKTGLLLDDDAMVDDLENAARARGWTGETWLQSLPSPFNKLPFIRAFIGFAGQTTESVSGPQLAGLLRKLFADLKVRERLQKWAETDLEGISDQQSLLRSEVHGGVWEATGQWLENLELAFETTSLPLKQWLAIVEAGLSSLTVGVIPPALDQVLVGTVDRSRNPDLKMAIVLGLNETVFPAPPPEPPLLSEYDRDMLAREGVTLGRSTHEHIGVEQYLAYIACTRARERLVLTYAERDVRDKALNKSSIVQHVLDLLPEAREEPAVFDWRLEANHPSDIVVPLLRYDGAPNTEGNGLDRLAKLPLFAATLEQWRSYNAARIVTRLSPAVIEKLYGPEVAVSVSQLEDYASCAFKFFVLRGLRAEERQEFTVDRRLRGTFQHNVLQQFHETIAAQGKRWRDLAPTEARTLIQQIGSKVQGEIENGIFLSTPEWRFAAETLIEGLQRLVAVLLGWAKQYEFEPQAVELGFGRDGDPLPGWNLDLGNGHVLVLRGRIDRVDVDKTPTGEGRIVVMDYKAGGQKVDDLRLATGLDLQLLAYLAALRQLPDAAKLLGCDERVPAGGFYLPLRESRRSAKNRDEALQQEPNLYQHAGRFRVDLLARFDNRNQLRGDQFNYSITQSGTIHKRCKDAVAAEEFAALVSNTEALLREFGRAISSGDVRVNPFRHREQTACQRCDFAPVCRFDSWVQPFRSLVARGLEDGGVRAGAEGAERVNSVRGGD